MHIDDNSDHNCDYCGKILSECGDATTQFTVAAEFVPSQTDSETVRIWIVIAAVAFGIGVTVV